MVPGAPERLLVGLGNPGARYALTRHNLGFRVVELLARRWGAGAWHPACESLVVETQVAGLGVWLAKPQTYMNRSGSAARQLARQSGVEIGRIVVVHDDLDLPLGRLRIRVRGGHGGHNGLRSVIESLGTTEFVRLKLGIGRPPEGVGVVDHVLTPFLQQEEAALPEFLARAVEAVESIIVEGPEGAMNLFPA